MLRYLNIKINKNTLSILKTSSTKYAAIYSVNAIPPAWRYIATPIKMDSENHKKDNSSDFLNDVIVAFLKSIPRSVKIARTNIAKSAIQ